MKKCLNFGCGNDIKTSSKECQWDNIDIQKSSKLTKSFDFNKFPYPIKDNTYDYIYARNVLEHLDEPDKVINELWRITKPGGIIRIIVPHYTNKGAYSDMQHKHFFNEVAFQLLEEQRTVINKTRKFRIKKLELKPTSVGKFFVRPLRETLALFINGLISEIDVEIEVLKKKQ